MEESSSNLSPEEKSKSKTLGLFFIIILTFIIATIAGFYFGTKTIQDTEHEPPVTETEINTREESMREQTRLFNETCGEYECLLESLQKEPFGYGIIEGIYATYERTAWEHTETCEGIEVTGGSTELFNYFTKKHERQTLNLNLEHLSEEQKQIIRESSADNPVSLLVTHRNISGFGPPPMLLASGHS